MNRITFSMLPIALVAMLIAGCGGGGSNAGSDSTEGGDTVAEEYTPAGSAVVSGSIQFTGTAPEQQELNLDRECMDIRDTNGMEPALSQRVVVNDNGTLRWVFVYVKDGLGDMTFPASSEPVVLDQVGCSYIPHVFGVQAGQPIQIRNSDALLHNIHAMPEANRPFNFGMPTAGQQREEVFRVPEVMARIKCDVHPWMESFAGVTAHPYFSTSDETGGYSIDGLPAGDYVIEAWHEEYGIQGKIVTVADGESVTLDFIFGDGAEA